MTISIGLSSGWTLSTLFRWNVLVVAAIGLCCSTVTTASEILTQQSPKEVLLRCRDAIDQVSTLKCSAVILAPSDKDSHTDAEGFAHGCRTGRSWPSCSCFHDVLVGSAWILAG